MTPKWHVGQEVCMVCDGHCRLPPIVTHAKITKIGRKWATLDDSPWRPSRFNIETGAIDGGEYSSPGMVYPSREAYQAETARQQAWDVLMRALNPCHHLPPAHLTTEEIVEFTTKIKGGK